MRNFLYIISCSILFALITSCKTTSHNLQIRKMEIVFDTLGRNDYTTINNLTAEFTVEYKKGKLTKAYSKQLKTGSFNDLFLIHSPKKKSLLGNVFPRVAKLMKQFKLQKDYGTEFAMYTLIKKYPDVDYFMNVRINKLRETKGKITTETVKLEAIGVDLNTDIDLPTK